MRCLEYALRSAEEEILRERVSECALSLHLNISLECTVHIQHRSYERLGKSYSPGKKELPGNYNLNKQTEEK